MAIADDLLGRTLRGRGRDPKSWFVHEKIAAIQGHSAGFFSVAYKCRDENGVEAFLKASDLTKVISADQDNSLQLLVDATQAHNFERQILEHCRGNRMDRVVTALDFGNENIIHEGVSQYLFFLVFELADGDLRKRISRQEQVSLIWIVSALHEYAVAVSQLHNGQVYHNDIKPANALVFSDGSQKIADLGRATTPLMAVAHDYGQCVGDTRFAAPEQIYRLEHRIQPHERFDFYKAGDLYNLGSLAHYLLTGLNVTPEIVSRLRPELRPPTREGGGWQDSVTLILPYWREVIGELIQETSSMKESYNDATSRDQIDFLTSMIIELCEPDYKKRGDKPRVGTAAQYDLARYITRLDLSRTKLIVASSHAK